MNRFDWTLLILNLVSLAWNAAIYFELNAIERRRRAPPNGDREPAA